MKKRGSAVDIERAVREVIGRFRSRDGSEVTERNWEAVEYLLLGILKLGGIWQVRLARGWRECIRNPRLVNRLRDAWFDEGGRKRIENWMEVRFRKDMGLTPKRVAFEYWYYKRLKRELMPFLVITAQRVKDRMRKRGDIDGKGGLGMAERGFEGGL